MSNILSDEKISANLCAVIEALGMNNASFSKRIKKSLANVIEYRENKRRAIHLVPFLIELGINGNWYLTGEGEMFLRDVTKPALVMEPQGSYNNQNPDYSKIGKMLVDAVEAAMYAAKKRK